MYHRGHDFQCFLRGLEPQFYSSEAICGETVFPNTRNLEEARMFGNIWILILFSPLRKSCGLTGTGFGSRTSRNPDVCNFFPLKGMAC